MHVAHPFFWFSATQISLGKECERKYGFQYILKIKPPPSKAMQLGLDVEQEEICPYLVDGRPFSTTAAGKIAAPALPFLPPPKIEGLVLQQKFEIETVRPDGGGYGFLGYKDARYPSCHVLPKLNLAPGIPLVVDFKTTKYWNFRKTVEKLRTDVQANLYAFDEFVTNPELDYVDLYWVSMRTTPEKPLADSSYLRVHKDHVAEQFAAIERTAERLYQIRSAAPPDDATEGDKLAYVMTLEPNANACDGWGGCPHRRTCNMGPKRQRAATLIQLRTKKASSMTTPALSALQRLKARKPAETSPPVTPEPEAPLGINPPEKDLPLIFAEPPATETSTAVEESAQPKTRRGRPAGSKNKAKAAEESVDPKYQKYVSDEYLGTAPAEPIVDVVAVLRAAAKAFLEATGGV